MFVFEYIFLGHKTAKLEKKYFAKKFLPNGVSPGKGSKTIMHSHKAT